MFLRHMSRIWGPGLQQVELFQHTEKTIFINASESATYGVFFSNIRALFKHIGALFQTYGFFF